jgi:hypothetical protein
MAAHLQTIREKGNRSANQHNVIAGSIVRARAAARAAQSSNAGGAISAPSATSSPAQAPANASTAQGYYAHRGGKLTFIHGQPFGGKGGGRK